MYLLSLCQHNIHCHAIRYIICYCIYVSDSVTVFGVECSRCGTLCMFDGSREGILNMGSILISHMVLRDYLLHFVHGRYVCKCQFITHVSVCYTFHLRSTLYYYYLVWCERQADAQDPLALEFKTKLSYHLFCSAWLHYIALLDLKLDNAFCCPDEHCGSAPEVMICNATALAFQQQYDCWKDLLHDQQAMRCDSTTAVEGR